jgi:HlyD family type I secretion membrane fusion protein
MKKDITKHGEATDLRSSNSATGNRVVAAGALRREDAEVAADWKRPAAIGYAIIVFTFVILGGWAAFAQLDSAVTAPGTVAVETNRKAVQHLEGGLISEIFVREGQRVNEGDVLFRLDPTQAKASYELQRSQLDFLLAQEARLSAEREGSETIVWPVELQDNGRPNVLRAIDDQNKQFLERRASLLGQIDLLNSKIEQYNTEIGGLTLERKGTTNQLMYINEELVDVNQLLKGNLVPKSRALSLERERSRLEGVVGRSTADEAKARTGIGETELQIRQIRTKFLEDVAGAILDIRQKISDAREKLRVATDVFQRLDIVAPVSGSVQSLKVFTISGVIKAGDTLAEIVPDHDALIIQAHISPHDMDIVSPGMRAEVRFTSFQSSVLPIVLGRLENVSRDRLLDDVTHQPYFLANVIAEDVPEAIRKRLVAGMPADLVFSTGERTVLTYLVRPLKDRMGLALREK